MAVQFISSNSVTLENATGTVDVNTDKFDLSGLSANCFVIAVIANADTINPNGITINSVTFRPGESGEISLGLLEMSNNLAAYTAFLDPADEGGIIRFNVTPTGTATMIASIFLFDNVDPMNWVSDLIYDYSTGTSSIVSSTQSGVNDMVLSFMAVNGTSLSAPEQIEVRQPKQFNIYKEAGSGGACVSFGSSLQNGVIGGIVNCESRWNNSLPYSQLLMTVESV